MKLNNRTFTLLKIVLLIIISIFIAEIIVLPKIEHDMLQEAGRQELVTVQQICGAVLENYPDVEQDFILGLRQPTNSLQEKGEQISWWNMPTRSYQKNNHQPFISCYISIRIIAKRKFCGRLCCKRDLILYW